MADRHKQLKQIHRAADFYEPRMASAFVRDMEKLQKSINVDRLATAIAHRSLPILSETIEQAHETTATVSRNAAEKGLDIGWEAVEDVVK